MNKTVLAGNGLNQCLKNGIPWGNLLEKIGNSFNLEVNKDIPMPLEFERLINTHLRENPKDAKDIYNRVKKEVANILLNVELPENAIHKELKKTKLDSIITTNYDCVIEKAFDESIKPIIHEGVAGQSTKYLNSETSFFKGISFYHAHGCVAVPSTICLGYEHYMGIIQRMRNDINRIPKGQEKKEIVNILEGTSPAKHTWMERFYTDNIHILGLGLYECETDLWWLLTHRASLYYSDSSGYHSSINNHIVYYDVIDDIKKEKLEEENKRQVHLKAAEKKYLLLEGMHVKVRKKHLSGTTSGEYEEAYKNIIEEIMVGD